MESAPSRTVCFLHGKESGPWGAKIRVLAPLAEKRGCKVVSPDFRGLSDPVEREARLLEYSLPEGESLVLVGSSMGGYVATRAAQRLAPAGLFLMAPAFYLPGYPEQGPAPRGRTAIVHGWDDEVVPPENVIRFARTHAVPLHLLPAGHSLSEDLPGVAKLFGLFLDELGLSV